MSEESDEFDLGEDHASLQEESDLTEILQEESDSASPFFVNKKAAAVLKHGILRSYVVPFVSKIGKYSTDSRVVFLDGYAGPGRYADGTPGSPALILQSAQAVSAFRNLECYFVERKREDFNRLQALITEANANGIKAEARKGRVEKHLDDVLAKAEGVPLLAFLDPFGLGVSFTDLTEKILGPGRPHRPGTGTEVLLNFSANAVRRIGGLLNSTKVAKGKDATLAAMDSACGGAWWREVFLSARNNAEAVEKIAYGYADLVSKKVGAHAWVVAVRNRVHHQQPVYHLVFFTRHTDGLWLFGEANSLAQEAWRKECAPPHVVDENALFDLGDPFEKEEKLRKEAWVGEIYSNIERILATDGPFFIAQRHGDVLGGTVDVARALHIRAAVTRLYADGKTACNGKGDVAKMYISAPPAK
ncbi:three-Cys-motif partner protein TcmP [Catellatospora aurea]|uniref:Three-Cys-motif partner protein TcmP n=1 Tax=Catellatospora aurea TaxID=1337874 RepID=A0ABW2H1J3_9ACTN